MRSMVLPATIGATFRPSRTSWSSEECEAFELYLAESRLMDPSNYYTLWCFPGLKRIKLSVLTSRGASLMPTRP